MKPKSLNSAGRLAELFVTSKLTLIFIAVCVVLGAIAVLLTPREETPQIIVPSAQVTVVMPGASALEIEQLVIRPLETAVQPITGVDHTYAAALNSVGVLTVQFKTGENKEQSMVKLYDRINGRRDLLPAGALPPVIRSIDVDDVPVVTLALASDTRNEFELKRLADRMAEGLRSLPNVSAVFVKGGQDRQLRIEIEPERVQAYGITLDQVRALIGAGNVSAPLGTIVQSGENRSVRLDGFISQPEELSRLMIGNHQGRPIYLGDVARIVDGAPEERVRQSRLGFGPGAAPEDFARTQGGELPAVTVAAAKKTGTNAVFMANAVLERVEQMKARFVPQDVTVLVTRNDGQKANDAVNGLIEHLGIAVVCVFLVTTFFLGAKEGLIVGATVPLILALTLAADYLCGPTINRVTLYALILSLGMVVDAAIVVIENIHRQYGDKSSQDKRTITVQATNEIGTPTNLATIAVMLVFLSMLALTGMPRQFFMPAVFNVPVSMATSLIVAYVVVPWAANRWVKRSEHSEAKSAESHLQKLIRTLISWLLVDKRAKKLVFAATLAFIGLSAFQPLWQFVRPSGTNGPLSWFGVEMAMLPKDNKNTFNITLDLPENTPVETTDRLARSVSAVLRKVPEVENYQVWLGEAGIADLTGLMRGADGKAGPHVAEIRVNLVDKHKRSKTSIELVREIRPLVVDAAKPFPGTKVALVEDPPGPPVLATVQAAIYGPDHEMLRRIAGEVSGTFWKAYDMAEVSSSEVTDIFEYRIVPDREKAALSGLTTGEIAQTLRRLIDGEEVGQAHMPGEKNPVPIVFKIPRRHEVDPAFLSRIQVVNRQGQHIPVSELVRLEPSKADRPILHKDNERVAFVGGEPGKLAPVYAVLSLDKLLDGQGLPDGSELSTGNLQLVKEAPNTQIGYRILWDGEMRMTLDIYRELITALGLALLFIYVMLVVYYQSFSLPVIAMVVIPLGIAGVFPGHWLMQQQFSAPSIVGVLALAGVVVRNSLLIIDFTLDHLRSGMAPQEAIITAVQARLRPILLTGLAIILGNVIMLQDPVFAGMATSLIFGTVASTILTFVVIPVLLFQFLLRKGPAFAAGKSA
jgi:multidrug efflux pump subunit AcrB